MNENDHRYTVRLEMIQMHYKALGPDLEWSAERFRRLAETLQMTVYELGAVCRLKAHETSKYLSLDKFPDPVELHLTLLHRTVAPSSLPPVFPCLTEDPPS